MRRIALVAVLLVAPFLPVPPATAANEMQISSSSSVLYESCGDYDFTYSLGLPTGYSDYWTMQLELIGPDGTEVGSDFLLDEPSAGNLDTQLCESPNLPGTYTWTGTGKACDPDYDCVPIGIAPSSFTLRLPRTQTSLKANITNPRPGQAVKFVVTSRDERPNGYFGTSYANVVLQVRAATGWRRVGGDETTDSRGRVVIEARYTGGRKKLRAVTLDDEDRTGSTSRTVITR